MPARLGGREETTLTDASWASPCWCRRREISGAAVLIDRAQELGRKVTVRQDNDAARRRHDMESATVAPIINPGTAGDSPLQWANPQRADNGPYVNSADAANSHMSRHLGRLSEREALAELAERHLDGALEWCRREALRLDAQEATPPGGGSPPSGAISATVPSAIFRKKSPEGRDG